MDRSSIQSMRKIGESLKDKGFFEIDFVDGRINWVNQFALLKMGYRLNEITTMSIFDIVPPEFHEYVRNYVTDRQNNTSLYELWPFWSSDRSITWWYAIETNHEDPYIWLKSKYLNKTPQFGHETDSMVITLNLVQAYNDLISKIEKQENRIDQLEHSNTEHDVILKSIGGRLEHIESIAKSAADSAFESNEELKKLRLSFDESLERQTTEILRLIMTDSVHDERMKNFNSILQEAAAKAVDTATTKITKQSEIASQQMVKKVDEAGNKASRRVTIPLGFIMLLVTLIQIIVQIWRR